MVKLGCILFVAGHTTQAGGRIMGWKFTFATSLAVLLLFAAPSKLFAQCTWCTTLVEVCCDADTNGSQIELPCNTTEIWAHFDHSSLNRIWVEVKNLDTGTIIATSLLNCDCDRKQVWSGGTLSSGTNIGFRAKCYPCSGSDCGLGNAHVKFFSPSSNTCAPNCSGS